MSLQERVAVLYEKLIAYAQENQSAYHDRLAREENIHTFGYSAADYISPHMRVIETAIKNKNTVLCELKKITDTTELIYIEKTIQKTLKDIDIFDRDTELKKRLEKVGEKFENTFEFSKKIPYIPIEGVGINTASVFSVSILKKNKQISIFASGWFTGQNLVDEYSLVGLAELSANNKKIDTRAFEYPDYDFIMRGYPYKAIGDVIFNYNFTESDNVKIKLLFTLKLSVDAGINNSFYTYDPEIFEIK